ncbi:MAG: hypothetical protein RI913_994 [Pseudomonadota bacterium]
MAFDLATARPVGQKENLSAKDVVSEAVKNFPSSFRNVVSGTFEAISSPLQTGKAILDIGAGALQNVLPESIVQAIGEDKASREVANKVGEMYVQRYGSVEAAKRTIANDPAGFMSDVSAILTGGGAAVPKLGKVASFVDPMSLAVKGVAGVSKAAAPVLGMTTGAGSEAIKQAYKAGKEGGTAAEQFRANISGTAPITDVLDMAKQNLANMNNQKQSQYRSGMVNIKNDKTVLDFSGIDSAVSGAQAKTSYKGKVVNERAASEIKTVKDIIDDWKSQNPSEYHTPEGLDALKQRVGDVLEGIPYEQKQARAAVGEIYNSIKSEITKQAPTYAKVMKEYSEASELIKEIERSLSLGQKSSADTAVRKLQSLMRKNVNTNFGQRVELGKQLSASGQDIFPALSGQALSELTPMGLQRATSLGTAAGAFSAGGAPLAAASLLSSSPRLMGEAAFGAGLLGRAGGAAQKVIPQAFDPRMYNLLYQAGRIKER